MNAITFGMKRAFHGFLRVTRKPLALMGLTAARFDLLSVLVTGNGTEKNWFGVRQSQLRRALGVTAPVVTRMLRALEALGLVRRVRELFGDRRQIRVWLTGAGERCILKARRRMLGAARRLVLVAICFGRHRDAQQRFSHMAKLESYLSALRTRFGDTARLDYPWGHPDD
jgi:DNA-binding MarR family transcriptional regulator